MEQKQASWNWDLAECFLLIFPNFQFGETARLATAGAWVGRCIAVHCGAVRWDDGEVERLRAVLCKFALYSEKSYCIDEKAGTLGHTSLG